MNHSNFATRSTLALLCFLLSACSSIVNGKLDDLDVDCTGSPDGTVCGEGQLCLGEVCLNTRCGDGYVDVGAGEDCEDANEVSGDGCEPSSCAFSCASNEECVDEDPCNGSELCGDASHRCEAGTPPTEETMCDLAEGMIGVCAGGLCATPGCGDGFEDEDEECDDGNVVRGDGCEPNCTFSCVENGDCSDGDVCNGEETCDTATHTCLNGSVLACNDDDGCTADTCDPALGCTFTLIDGDDDGYADAELGTCTTAGLNGGDCNDSNDRMYPSAPELCDDVDNDCDVTVDEDIVEVQCRPDRDSDGYGNETMSMSACVCPANSIPPRPDGNLDCDDDDSNVYEGQTSYFTSRHCSGAGCGSNLPFDYNCDGVETRETTTIASTCTRMMSGIYSYCVGAGWTDRIPPACGVTRAYQGCALNGTFGCSAVRSVNRTQACR